MAAALGISFTFVTISTRILIRLFVNKGWGIDDTLCVAATVSLLESIRTRKRDSR